MRAPPAVAALLDEVLPNARFLVVQSSGPTSHVLSTPDGTSKFRVVLGHPSLCSCRDPSDATSSTDTPCIHILFVLTRLFRVPPSHPVLWGACYSERQIEDILAFKYVSTAVDDATRRQTRDFLRKSRHASAPQSVQMRPLTESSTCFVCFEALMPLDNTLTYCRAQCGNPVHIECMRIWGEHRRSLREPVTCPMCRAPFTSMAPVSFQKTSKPKATRQEKKASGESSSTTTPLSSLLMVNCTRHRTEESKPNPRSTMNRPRPASIGRWKSAPQNLTSDPSSGAAMLVGTLTLGDGNGNGPHGRSSSGLDYSRVIRGTVRPSHNGRSVDALSPSSSSFSASSSSGALLSLGLGDGALKRR